METLSSSPALALVEDRRIFRDHYGRLWLRSGKRIEEAASDLAGEVFELEEAGVIACPSRDARPRADRYFERAAS